MKRLVATALTCSLMGSIAACQRNSELTSQAEIGMNGSIPSKGGHNTLNIHNPTMPQVNRSTTPFTYNVNSDLKLLAATSQQIDSITLDSGTPMNFIADETYVCFEDDATQADIEAFLKAFKATIKRREIIPATENGAIPAKETNNYIVTFDDREVTISDDGMKAEAEKQGLRGQFQFSSKKAVKAFHQVLFAKKDKAKHKIKHIALDFLASHFLVPTNEWAWMDSWDPYTSGSPEFHAFWMHGTFSYSGQQGNRVNSKQGSAWDSTTAAKGENVKIAVIDQDFLLEDGNPSMSGNQPEPPHEQLLGPNMYDVNGTYYWYNFRLGNYNIQTYVPFTRSLGHGRKMASLIFSKENDNKGTAGVAPRAKPMLFDVGSSSSPGSVDNNHVASAINTARSWGARVINMSFGNEAAEAFATWQPYYQAVVDANAAGIIMVAGTGNTNNKTIYPAAYGEVMGVSAHNKLGDISYFNGNYANQWYADIHAAGNDITVAGNTAAPNLNSETLSNGGTSSACALVSGACALYVKQGKLTNTSSAINKVRRDAWTGRSDGRYILDVYWGTTTN